MTALLEHFGTPELILLAFVVIMLGLCGVPALFVAKARGRSPVGWFFLGIGVSLAVSAAIAYVVPGVPPIVEWVGVLVAPAILMSIPKLDRKRGAGQEPSVS
jgi:hypothetical protein